MGRIHKTQNAHPQTHETPGHTRHSQASPPHEMRPNGRISGGVGGTGPPTKNSPTPTTHQHQTLHAPPHPYETPGHTRHSQASPPHELRKGRAATPRGPFAIRGGGGDWSPHKKNKKQNAQSTTKKSTRMVGKRPMDCLIMRAALWRMISSMSPWRAELWMVRTSSG